MYVVKYVTTDPSRFDMIYMKQNKHHQRPWKTSTPMMTYIPIKFAMYVCDRKPNYKRI